MTTSKSKILWTSLLLSFSSQVTGEVRGIKEHEIGRLKSYCRLEEIISHRERSKRETDGEYDDVLERHRIISIKIDHKEAVLDLSETDYTGGRDTRCKYYNGRIRGDAASIVQLTNCGTWQGLIYQISEGNTFILEPISDTNHHIVYNIRDDPNTRFNALYGDHPVSHRRERRSSPRILNVNKMYTAKKVDVKDTTKYKIRVKYVLDDSMIQFHADEPKQGDEPKQPRITPKLEDYIGTLSFILDGIYHDPSLEISIDIVKGKVVGLSKRESQDMVFENNPDQTLNEVNKKMKKMDKAKDGESHDVTIFITRKSFGPSGYAPVKAMCNPNLCTINTDAGFTTAFLLAHELGHTLGMRHDGNDNHCKDYPTMGSIMAPTVVAQNNRYTWSPCSNKELRANMGSLKCLIAEDSRARKHTVLRNYRPVSAIKHDYTYDQQCQFEYGPEFIGCGSWHNSLSGSSQNSVTRGYDMGGEEMCKTIRCVNSTSPNKECISRDNPPLDGTVCVLSTGGKGGCYRGACVDNENIDKKSRDGEWTPWSEWLGTGLCSAECGTGAKLRERKCVGRQGSGRDCEGDGSYHMICNTQQCPHRRDRRTDLCQQLTNMTTMVPQIENSDPCKLSCWDYKTQIPHNGLQEHMVPDGTPCNLDNPHGNICIQGRCETASCDRELGSNATKLADSCGICGGDNSQCENLRFYFEQKLRKKRRKSETSVITIPKGAYATEISVTVGPRHIYFRFIDTRTGLVYENSKKKFQPTIVSGALLRQNEVENQRPVYEIKGELLNELQVQLVIKNRKSLKYYIVTSYTMKRAQLNPNKMRGSWVNGHGRCNAERKGKKCGEGKRYKTRQCVTPLGVQVRSAPEAIKVCGSSPKQVSHSHCRSGLCIPRMAYKFTTATQWSHCSLTCGKNGKETRESKCVKIKTGAEVDKKRCAHLDNIMLVRPCNDVICPAKWQYQDWSECSSNISSCGKAEQKRSVNCVRDGIIINNESCAGLPKPDSWKECTIECPQKCEKDITVFCRLMYLKEYCKTETFRRLCCSTCNNYSLEAVAERAIVESSYDVYTPQSPDYDVDDFIGTPLDSYPAPVRTRRSSVLGQVHDSDWSLEKLTEIGEMLSYTEKDTS